MVRGGEFLRRGRNELLRGSNLENALDQAVRRTSAPALRGPILLSYWLRRFRQFQPCPLFRRFRVRLTLMSVLDNESAKVDSAKSRER